MPRYVDGFLLPVPTKNLPRYRRISRMAGKIWVEHGALEYRECVGDDLEIQGMLSFSKVARCKPGETVMFSWIAYTSRAHRDRVNARVMKDERMLKICGKDMPFDVKKMAYGGFKAIVDLAAEE